MTLKATSIFSVVADFDLLGKSEAYVSLVMQTSGSSFWAFF